MTMSLRSEGGRCAPRSTSITTAPVVFGGRLASSSGWNLAGGSW